MVECEVSTPRPGRSGHQAFEVDLVDESKEHLSSPARHGGGNGDNLQGRFDGRCVGRNNGLRRPAACGPWPAAH